MKPAGKKIMILDDDFLCVELVSDLLTDSGYEVKSFSDPALAWEELPSVKPDCLVLDLNMPLLDGREFLPWARKIFPNLPVVVCSGLDIHDHQVFKTHHIQQIIHKPVSATKIIQAIEKALLETPKI